MELRLTNGATVTRMWNDKSTELLGGFQYQTDAVAFANMKLAEDVTRDWRNSSYLVCNHYNGEVTIIRPERQQAA